MSLTQSILVTTDFSPASELALDAASILAKTFGARVTLLHVFEPGTLAPVAIPGAMRVDNTIVPNLREKVAEELRRIVGERFSGVSAAESAIVESSSAADAICEFAKKIGADMIVMATHGRTGLSHMLIGSVTERVVRHAPCPVLSLRSKSG